MGQKLGRGSDHIFRERLGPCLTPQGRRGWGLSPCQVLSWPIQPFGHNKHGPKIGGSAAFFGEGSGVQVESWSMQSLAATDMGRKLGVCPYGRGGVGSPSNNVARADVYLHAKFHLDPSNRLATIHQRYRQTDMTYRQIAQGEPFYKRSPKN